MMEILTARIMRNIIINIVMKPWKPMSIPILMNIMYRKPNGNSHTYTETMHSHHGHHHHEHRGLNEIMEIIDHADMTDRAKSYGKRIFKILAEAEAKAHNVPVDQVYFHEVGAVDSIVDILSVAICMDDLDVEEVIVPRLCEGSGTIRCQHGILPVPVPAVSNIVSAHQLKLHITSVQGELITPTGAAIVAAFLTSEKLPEDFTVEKIGIGAGKRQYECPGILRAMLIRGIRGRRLQAMMLVRKQIPL